MSNDEVRIRDIHSIEELHNTIEYVGEAMATIEEQVSNYMQGVKDVLEGQLEQLRAELEEAEAELAEAENDLSRCYDSQTYDEEYGEYTPSCSCEERTVAAARDRVSECRRKYDEGTCIVHECDSEISDYYYNGMVYADPGGHYLIEKMVKDDTTRATELLREILEKLNDILETDMGNDEQPSAQFSNPYVSKEDRPMTQEERQAAFSQFIDEAKDAQAKDVRRENIQNANRAMQCPVCHMPLALCKCRRKRDDAVVL